MVNHLKPNPQTSDAPAPVNAPLKSKINLTGILTALAGAGALAGYLPEKWGAYAAAIGGIAAIILRTWFTEKKEESK
jgi:hypothetical protein